MTEPGVLGFPAWPHGSATFTQSAADGFWVRDPDSPYCSIPPGIHDVRIEYTVNNGPSWANLDIEFARIFFSGSDTCTSTEATLCPAFALLTTSCLV